MKLEELIGKYEIKSYNKRKFHKELVLYYEKSKKPQLSKQTETKWLNKYQLEICEKYKINYPTFLSNLNLLETYLSLKGGRS